MGAPPATLHHLAAVEAPLEALSGADEAWAVREKGSPIGVQSKRTVVQRRGLPHEPGLAKTLL